MGAVVRAACQYVWAHAPLAPGGGARARAATREGRFCSMMLPVRQAAGAGAGQGRGQRPEAGAGCVREQLGSKGAAGLAVWQKGLLVCV